MTPRINRYRRWSWIHKWSSVVCTLFMLMLCATGLPLIFHEEIDDLLQTRVAAASVSPGAPKADLDEVIASAVAHFPGQVPQFLFWDQDEPNVLGVSVGANAEAAPSLSRFARVDAHTGAFLDSPDPRQGFISIMLRLHTDMFAGLAGKLFLGIMGILFCVAIVSGIVVYAPSMRKLRFGAYRSNRPRVVRWLDVHNLGGIVLVAWTLVVGFTGVINTWADLVIKIWQHDQLAEMTAPYRDRPPPLRLSPVQPAVDLAMQTIPGMQPAFVAFPGTVLSSKGHYAVFMRGNTPLTSRLLKPALIDAETGQLTDSRDLPWYVSTLLISQPLHFGDYGGMALKIVWALLDVLTIVILITGLYLWLRKRTATAAAALSSDQRDLGMKVSLR